MLRYSHLAVILVAVFLPEQEWALPVLAVFHVVMTSLFFYLVFCLLCGLSKSNVNEDIDVHDMIILRMVTFLSLLVLFVSGEMVYIIIAAASSPWVITNTMTDIFAVLVKWEILEVTDKE